MRKSLLKAFICVTAVLAIIGLTMIGAAHSGNTDIDEVSLIKSEAAATTVAETTVAPTETQTETTTEATPKRLLRRLQNQRRQSRSRHRQLSQKNQLKRTRQPRHNQNRKATTPCIQPHSSDSSALFIGTVGSGLGTAKESCPVAVFQFREDITMQTDMFVTKTITFVYPRHR